MIDTQSCRMPLRTSLTKKIITESTCGISIQNAIPFTRFRNTFVYNLVNFNHTFGWEENDNTFLNFTKKRNSGKSIRILKY